MYSFTYFITFLTVVLAVSASPVKVQRRDDFASGVQCTPGQAFYMSCNICVCSEDGTFASCTFMYCIDDEDQQRSKRSPKEIVDELRKDIPRIYGYTQGQHCPAKSFYNDCNLCICGNDDASAACTIMMCLDWQPQVPKIVAAKLTDIARIDEYSEGLACPAGEFFRDKCNVCHCAANGLSAACTLMVCTSEDTQPRAGATEINNWSRIDDYRYGDPCPANEMFYYQCNTCHCSPDGHSAACTLKLCLYEK